MLKYIIEADYYKVFSNKKSIPSDFNSKVIEASNYINYHTHNRIDSENVSEQVKMATCFLVNLLIEEQEKLNKIGNLKSEDVEGWKQTYQTPEEIKQEYQSKKYEILKMYLVNEIGKDGLPLLYAGVI